MPGLYQRPFPHTCSGALWIVVPPACLLTSDSCSNGFRRSTPSWATRKDRVKRHEAVAPRCVGGLQFLNGCVQAGQQRVFPGVGKLKRHERPCRRDVKPPPGKPDGMFPFRPETSSLSRGGDTDPDISGLNDPHTGGGKTSEKSREHEQGLDAQRECATGPLDGQDRVLRITNRSLYSSPAVRHFIWSEPGLAHGFHESRDTKHESRLLRPFGSPGMRKGRTTRNPRSDRRPVTACLRAVVRLLRRYGAAWAAYCPCASVPAPSAVHGRPRSERQMNPC